MPVSLEVADADEESAELLGWIAAALESNPDLRRMRSEAGAAWQRIPQVRSLPDPMLSGSVYAVPMMMADGEARGTLMLSQTFPAWKQLDARGRRASLEAMLLEQQLRAAELRVAADLQEAWYRLYLQGQLLRINEANRQLVESLVRIASARVEVGETAPGDVILGSLELSRLEEERLQIRQQIAARTARFNQLLNRPADAELAIPRRIGHAEAGYSLDELRMVAFQEQPEIIAARLRTEADGWGIRIAELERVPEVTLSYEQMFMQMNPGDQGSDPWQIGVGINVPLWHQKYAAMRREAVQQHLASQAGVDQAIRANEALLLDLLEQARAADRTARLYHDTILPQTRQALESDQRAYGQGVVQFERVVGNARNLLAAESAWHRAVTEQAIAAARLEQAVGARLVPAGEEVQPANGALPPPEPLPRPD